MNPTNKKGIQLNELKISSAYGKDNAQSFIDSSELLYKDANKKRVSEWEKRTRLHLPVGDSVTNSNNSISDKSNPVKNNIPDSGANNSGNGANNSNNGLKFTISRALDEEKIKKAEAYENGENEYVIEDFKKMDIHFLHKHLIYIKRGVKNESNYKTDRI